VLTLGGWALLVGGVVCGVGAATLGYPELIVLALACGLALLIAVAWTAARPRLLVMREIQPTRVTVGGPALGLVTVTNRGARPSTALLARERVGDESIDVPLPRLGTRATRSVTYRLPTGRRGVVAVGPMTITRTDPLGLIRIVQRHGSVETLWVYPRIHPVEPLSAGRRFSLEGPTSDLSPHGTVSFHALREYVVGDDPRRIHWRSTAHTGTLMVRQFVDTSLPNGLIVLDTRQASYREPAFFEEAVEIAASLVAASTLQNFPIRLRTTSGLTLGASSGMDARRVLDQLAGVQLDAPGGLNDLAGQLTGARQGMSLSVVTSEPSEADIASTLAARSSFDAATMICARSREGRPPLAVAANVVVVDVASALEFAQAWTRLYR